jgi:hypothetical protein
MMLRPELMPPVLDKGKLAQLAKLAPRLDGASPGQGDDELAEFNRLAGTALGSEDFQGIYGAEDHDDWVRRLLYRNSLVPTVDLTREEMVEIVSRVLAVDSVAERDFYLELFLINCKHRSGSDLLYWPNLVPELPQGREPTVEEVADLAMQGQA